MFHLRVEKRTAIALVEKSSSTLTQRFLSVRVLPAPVIRTAIIGLETNPFQTTSHNDFMAVASNHPSRMTFTHN